MRSPDHASLHVKQLPTVITPALSIHFTSFRGQRLPPGHPPGHRL
jgi:hypothetical protein